ncbi:PAS domain S-box protein [Algibacter miyuki]|uniref:histidine kinase n=1 Tax=Algibacter miyuki TaxID=1306933 RepID=A0ABV5H527_9FLAO|nr:PAS domain S-box protein [Algibacter miyuki]MDN3665483.1 PAS domain S-box protein [Algibacter miyuki]
MKNLKRSIKYRYKLLLLTIAIIIAAVLFIIHSGINSQISNANVINIITEQRALSQRFNRIVHDIGFGGRNFANKNTVSALEALIDSWHDLDDSLKSGNNQNGNNSALDSLIEFNKDYFKSLRLSSARIIDASNVELLKIEVEKISEAEKHYLQHIDTLLSSYQKAETRKLRNLKIVIYAFAISVFLLMLGSYLFILFPSLKAFSLKSKELIAINEELSASEERIKKNVLELEILKADLEIKDTYNKIFIEQAPTAIAMLDTNMCYIAASKEWILDYKMEDEEVIGRCHYDLFPEIGEDWKANHQKCLNGAIDKCDEAPFVRKDGTVQWIYWDVRPWYISEGVVGGLIMHTGDITHLKEKEEEKERIEKILDKTNEIARIGTWDIDLIKGTIFWSKVVFEIHEVPENYEPDLETAIAFFKEGESRDAIEEAVKRAMELGTSYDLELELITAKGNTVWTRAIGQAEFVDGNCIRLFGVFQDIDIIKKSELALNKAHTELKAIFNSGTIAIVSTDTEGIINHFNHGAEILTGYSASEIVGIKRPIFYHLEDEIENFRIDIAKRYGKSLEGFRAQLELSKTNAHDTREWTYLRKDGTTLPVQLTLTSIKDEQNNLIGYLGVSTDVSEKRIAENELLRKNQLLTFAEKITMMGSWQWDIINNTGKISAGMCEIYEIDSSDSTMGFDEFFNFVHPDDKEKVALHVKGSVEEKAFENNFLHRIITAKGNVKIVQLLGKVITNEVGEVIEIIGACQDITEQKMKEAELLRKNHFLSFAERITKMGNWQWEVVTDTLTWSANLYGIFEHDVKEVNLKYDTFFSYVHPDDKAFITRYVEDAFIEKKFPENFIHRIITGNGTIKTVHFMGEVILDDQGEVLEMIGTCQDVTEQKMEENKFRGLLESAPDAMVITNEQGKIQLINKQAEKLFGYHIDELIGESVEILIPKRFLGTHETHRVGFFNTPRVRSIGDGKELYGINKAGKEIPIQISLSPLETEQGVLVSAAIRDITEQKLAKNELLRKNQLLNFAEEITLMGHWIWNILEDRVEWSSNLYNIFELEKEEVDLRFNTYFSFVHPEDKDLVSEYFDNAAKGGGFTNFSHRILTNGKVKTVQLLGEVGTNDSGSVIEMIGTCQDITEQKMAENKFRGLLESAPDAMVITDENSKIQMINKQAEKMFGYKIEELFNKSVDLLLPKRFLTGCESKVNTVLGDLMGTESSGDEELKAMNKKGEEFPVQINLSPLETEEGVLVSAAIRDISAQKLAQAELVRKNQLLTFAEKINVMGNWQWDIVNDELKWSSNLYGIFGLDENKTDLSYETYFSFVHPADKEAVTFYVRKSIEEKKFYNNFEHRIIASDGKVKFIHLLGVVNTNDSGEILELVGTCQDITEKKEEQDKIIEAKNNLENLAQKLTFNNKQLADFTHITSHNLRAPVSNLNSLLGFYNASESTEEKTLLFAKFEKVINHLTLTLNTLVDAVRIKNNTPIELEDIAFEEVLNKTKEILSGEIIKNNVIFSNDFSKVNKIRYNRIYIESIFLNLVGNSIKYRSPYRTPEISIQSEIIDGNVILQFKDNGLGIDLERHGHKLFGLNKVFHRHPEAKGVGLFMVKAQVEALGGVVSATSEVDKGSVFSINFNKM